MRVNSVNGGRKDGGRESKKKKKKRDTRKVGGQNLNSASC